jgi:maltose O-acetyltransferase
MSIIKFFSNACSKFKNKKISYEDRKKNNIESYRKLGVKIGHNSDIIESTLDGFFPFLIEIGNNCILTGATILCHDSSHVIFSKRIKVGKVKIGDSCFIGRNAVVMPGVTIGQNSIVGVNAVVTHSVPEKSIVVGSPGKIIGNTDNIGEKEFAGENCFFVENVIGNFLSEKEIKLIRKMVRMKFE